MPTETIIDNKTVNINIRTDQKTKEQSEKILSSMGLSMSAAINTFLHQVISDRALPFRPTSAPALPDESTLSEEELHHLLEESLIESEAEEGIPIDAAFSDLLKEHRPNA